MQVHKWLEPRAKIIVFTAVLVIIFASPFLLPFGAALSDDAPTCSFAGTVKLDGADVADGTAILATIEGDEFSTTTPTGYGTSTYFIAIKPPDTEYYTEGSEVSFKVNGYAADQTGIWKSGQSVRLDLTASTASGTEIQRKLWPIVGLIIACIVEVSIVGAVVYLTLRL